MAEGQPDLTSYFALGLLLLAPLVIAGLALMSTGLIRSRSAAHGLLLSSLVGPGVAILTYLVCGLAVEGVAGQAGHTFQISGKAWDWIGGGPLFLHGFKFDNSAASVFVLLQFFGVAIASAIPTFTAAERWRLGATCASTALFAGFLYPLFAHWVWSGGWLSSLGTNYGLGHGFLDPGGAARIQAVGGLTALSMAWVLGPRKGKFSHQGMPAAIPGHNAVVVLFGSVLTLVGWLALNLASALLLFGAASISYALIVLNTVFSAAAAAIAALSVTRIRFGRPDASLTANGWVGGLVASSAVSPFVKPAEAVLIGLIAGALVIFSIEVVELRCKIDDPAGAISVHAVAGVWGILALGMFGRLGGLPEAAGNPDNSGQFLAQLIGVATLLGFVLPASYAVNWALNRILHQRVSAEGEHQGMDLFELGAGAYPEFATHRDDFTRR